MSSEEGEIKSGVEQAAQESQALIAQSNWLKALQVALGAPTGSKDAAVRDQAAASVAACLVAIKDADVAKVIGELTDEQRNSTMKYVYRAMANPAGQNCTKLLQWHDKLYEKDGPGIIMRTLVDRKINGNPEPATK